MAMYALALLLLFPYLDCVQPAGHGDNLKRYGGFIPAFGRARTAEYIDRVLTRLTLSDPYTHWSVCCQLINAYNVPFYFGGTC